MLIRPLVASALAAVTLAPAAGAQDLSALRDRGTLRVVVQPDSPPERFALDSSAEPGFEKEILLGFAALQRLELEVLTRRTQDAIAALNSGEADVIAEITFTDSRREMVDFTSEVLPACHVALTRSPTPPVRTLEALRNGRVGTMRGSSWAEAAAAAGVPPSRVVSFATGNEVLEALTSGRISVAVISALWAMLAQKAAPDLEIGLFVGERTGVGYATRKGSPLLRAALDAYLGHVRRSGAWNRLVVKYFGDRSLPILKQCGTAG